MVQATRTIAERRHRSPADDHSIHPAQCLPNEYEGTFAHEFQHLIHHDIDPDEYSWVNEGCSTLAEYINGYGMGSNLAYYITDFWETSLTQWEGMLANYGCVQLWAVYMYEHYGGQPFIWALVHEQANGIQGVNNVLKARHIHKTFDEIFQDWEIANYLDDTSFANGIYGYYGIDLPCTESQWYGHTNSGRPHRSVFTVANLS